MFNLRPGYEEQKALTVLSGHTGNVCAVCALPARTGYLCDKCRWHYQRKQYHAVYHFILRSAHLAGEYKQVNFGWASRCARCIKYYRINNPVEYVSLPESHESWVASYGHRLQSTLTEGKA